MQLTPLLEKEACVGPDDPPMQSQRRHSWRLLKIGPIPLNRHFSFHSVSAGETSHFFSDRKVLLIECWHERKWWHCSPASFLRQALLQHAVVFCFDGKALYRWCLGLCLAMFEGGSREHFKATKWWLLLTAWLPWKPCFNPATGRPVGFQDVQISKKVV